MTNLSGSYTSQRPLRSGSTPYGRSAGPEGRPGVNRRTQTIVSATGRVDPPAGSLSSTQISLPLLCSWRRSPRRTAWDTLINFKPLRSACDGCANFVLWAGLAKECKFTNKKPRGNSELVLVRDSCCSVCLDKGHKIFQISFLPGVQDRLGVHRGRHKEQSRESFRQRE